ncbi:DNA-deoxyinosine glycosylase [Prevotella denticola]|nr:DNA-deoxyinosine glycosylase [Prevotella denticola]
MTLHEAIICVLKTHSTAMSCSDIAKEIYSKKLYLQKNGSMAPPRQIRARVKKYPQYFVIKDAKIHLSKSSELTKKLQEKKTFNLHQLSFLPHLHGEDGVKKKSITQVVSPDFKKGFMPWIDKNTKVLILGTMPGDISTEQLSYYLNPSNTFWKIMNRLFNSTDHFEKSRDFLSSIGIGLWDVYKEGIRKGSLDSGFSIHPVPNDIKGFIKKHKSIKYIVFNGKEAHDAFLKEIGDVNVSCIVMPSTSSTNTHMTFDEKFDAWTQLKKILKQVKHNSTP